MRIGDANGAAAARCSHSCSGACAGVCSPDPAARQITALPTARDVAPTPEARQLLRQATVDFRRVLAGQYPIYARFKTAPRVGARVYANTGYTIVDTPLLLAGDDRMFHQSGVTLTLEPPITTSPTSYRDERLTRRSLVPVAE